MVKTDVRQAGYTPVANIDKHGQYLFGKVCSLDGHTEPVFSANQPDFRWGSFLRYIKEKFPQTIAREFYPGCSACGNGTKLEVLSDWPTGSVEGIFLTFQERINKEKENYKVTSSGHSSSGYDSQFFRIEDSGRIAVVKKKLVVEDSKKRNGILQLQMDGTEPNIAKLKDITPHWKATVIYGGDSSGRLIKAVVDYINSEKARLKIPLFWQK